MSGKVLVKAAAENGMTRMKVEAGHLKGSQPIEVSDSELSVHWVIKLMALNPEWMDLRRSKPEC